MQEDVKIFFIEPYNNYAFQQVYALLASYYAKNITKDILEASVVWSFCSFENKISRTILKRKKVIQTLDFIVTNKLDQRASISLLNNEEHVDFFHVFSQPSKKQFEKVYDKIIYKTSIGIDKKKFAYLDVFNVDKLKIKMKIPTTKFVIGNNNYCTDTLANTQNFIYERGTDTFSSFIDEYSVKDLYLILFDQQHNKFIKFLTKNQIEFIWIKNPTYTERKNLYRCCNLFVNTPRYDGNSLNVLELSNMKIPTISTKTGNASYFLSKKSVGNNLLELIPDVDASYDKARKFTEKRFLKEIEDMFRILLEC